MRPAKRITEQERENYFVNAKAVMNPELIMFFNIHSGLLNLKSNFSSVQEMPMTLGWHISSDYIIDSRKESCPSLERSRSNQTRYSKYFQSLKN